jgi:hypothetical protein
MVDPPRDVGRSLFPALGLTSESLLIDRPIRYAYYHYLAPFARNSI